MRSRLLLPPLLLLAGLTACSSDDDGVTPEAFAKAVCGAVASWQGELGTGAADLRQRSDAAADPRALKKALVGFLTLVTGRTDRLSGEVGAAGTPDGEGGAALAGEVRGRVEAAHRLFDAARADADSLPEDDAAAVARGAENIGRAVTEGREAVGAPLSGPVGSPVRDALRGEPACRGLTG